jgi:hypothetical protein
LGVAPVGIDLGLGGRVGKIGILHVCALWAGGPVSPLICYRPELGGAVCISRKWLQARGKEIHPGGDRRDAPSWGRQVAPSLALDQD